MWQTSLTPGSVFGGVIGSAAFVDGRLVMSSNVGDPNTNAPTNASKLFSLDPATGEIQWTSEELTGKVFGPVGAVSGAAFVGTDANTMYAFDTATVPCWNPAPVTDNYDLTYLSPSCSTTSRPPCAPAEAGR